MKFSFFRPESRSTNLVLRPRNSRSSGLQNLGLNSREPQLGLATVSEYLTHQKSYTQNKTLVEALLLFLAVGLLALSSQIRIHLPFTPVPITGQTLSVLLIGATYGARRGASSVFVYLLLGAVGAPFWAGGASGLAALFGPTGGYLVGFLAAAFTMGWLAERHWDRNFKSAWTLFFLGHSTIFVFGILWLSRFVGFQAAILQGYVPFLPGEIIKTTLAALILARIRKD